MTAKRHRLRQSLATLMLFFAFSSSAFAKSSGREKVLFLGSSTIANWASLPQNFPSLQTINEGIGGTTYRDLLKSSGSEIRKYRPDKIVLYSGDNDLAEALLTPEQVAHDFSRVLNLIQMQAPQAEIFVISVKPSPGRWSLVGKILATNKLIRRIALRNSDVRYIDVFPKMLTKDGQVLTDIFDPQDEMHIHMSRTGYDLWASILRPYLSDRVAEKAVCERLL